MNCKWFAISHNDTPISTEPTRKHSVFYDRMRGRIKQSPLMRESKGPIGCFIASKKPWVLLHSSLYSELSSLIHILRAYSKLSKCFFIVGCFLSYVTGTNWNFAWSIFLDMNLCPSIWNSLEMVFTKTNLKKMNFISRLSSSESYIRYEDKDHGRLLTVTLYILRGRRRVKADHVFTDLNTALIRFTELIKQHCFERQLFTNCLINEKVNTCLKNVPATLIVIHSHIAKTRCMTWRIGGFELMNWLSRYAIILF